MTIQIDGKVIMKKKYDLIIFDLDGTLIDTSKGIFNSVRYAESKMGFTPTAQENLYKFVGPPPKKMYMELYGVDEVVAMRATFFHREYGKEKAIYEAVLYNGMDKVLSELKKQGYFLGVATLKRQDIAEKILEITGIKNFFDVIVGVDKDETITKAKAIELCVTQYSAVSRSLMIGDSPYDEEGAKEVGIDFWGVNYGFGFSDRSQKVDTPTDIIIMLSQSL